MHADNLTENSYKIRPNEVKSARKTVIVRLIYPLIKRYVSPLCQVGKVSFHCRPTLRLRPPFVRVISAAAPTGALSLSTSTLSRLALVILTAWGMSMVLPSFHRLVWPLGSFGLTVDNNGVVVDVVGPFDRGLDRSPAAAAGLAIGDRLDLQQMNCWAPSSHVCAALVTLLGGSGGLQETLPGQEVDLVIRPATGGARRTVHLHAKLAPLDLPGRLVLLADTVVSILSTLAAAWLVWVRPGWMTWGFFLYFFWFNPGQTYTYYAILQSQPLLLLIEQCLDGLATGAALGGLLIFALSFPESDPDPRWHRWTPLVPWLGAVMAALQLLSGANLFGVPTEGVAAAGYIYSYGLNAVALALLLVRRRKMHPRNEQRMRWVIAGSAIGLPTFIFAELGQTTGLLQNTWGSAPSQTVLGLLYLVQGVLAYFVWTAVRRQRVISVAIPLRRGTVTTVLTLALAVPVMFLHERIAEIQEALHLPGWLWPLVVAPVVLIALQRLHGIAVELADHAFHRAYHQARQGLEQAGRTVLEADNFSTIDRWLVEAPVRYLRLTSAAVFRDVDGVWQRTMPTIGWAAAPLRQLRPDLDAPVMECLTRGKPLPLLPRQWQRDGSPSDELAPCLAMPIFGWAGQSIALVLFGPHESGSDITPDECDLLHMLAIQAGHGYDRVEKETLRRELHDLRAQLAGRAEAPPTER